MLRNVDQIQESELDRVEIMLIDIMLESDRKWLAAEKVAQMPQLKFIQCLRAGVDAIDLEQLPKSVIICGNVGAYSDPMAEHTIGMILYLAKDLGIRNSKLENGVVDSHNSLFLKGKTIGVIGAGGIGQAVAKIAKSLEMKTFGVNTSGKHVRYFDETFEIRRLDKVLRVSDVIVTFLTFNGQIIPHY